ncbi:MAG: c-type cytochrome [Nitrospinota bacterium]
MRSGGRVLWASAACCGLLLAAAPAKAQKGDPSRGKYLYGIHCVVCHGDAGDGDGPTASSLDPRPRDFRDGSIMDKRTDAELLRVIRDGGPSVGKSYWMPPWGPLLSERELRDLLSYIRTFRRPPPGLHPGRPDKEEDKP